MKVAGVFFSEPTKQHYLIEISQKSGIAHTSVKNYLIDLKKMSIINETSEKKGRRKFPLYAANLDSREYKKYKRLHNLIKIEESGLIDFLNDECAPKSIVLFGSYLRGEDTEDSDVDIFLECKKKDVLLDKFEKQLSRKIQLHFKENFESFPRELKNNIINGFAMRGYLEVFR